MRPIIFAVYISLFLLLNIFQIKKLENINNDILFDYVSLIVLFISLLTFYIKYSSISLSMLTIFIMIFIIFLYMKDTKYKTIKTILIWFLLINIYMFMYGTLRYFFF